MYVEILARTPAPLVVCKGRMKEKACPYADGRIRPLAIL